MVKKILIVLIFLLSGGAITLSNQPLATMAVIQSAIAAPKWESLVEGSDIKTDLNYTYYPSEMKLSNGMLLRGVKWDGFLKGYIESFPIEKRHDILNGLTRFYKEYDKVEKIIKFEPLRYISGPYATNSHLSLKGSLTKSKANASLKIYYYGRDWIFANRIKVVADDFTWESANLKFYRDNYDNVWEYAYLGLSEPEHRQLADKIATSKEAIIRFYGEQYYSDLEVTERMKKDISAMLKAIDTINGK